MEREASTDFQSNITSYSCVAMNTSDQLSYVPLPIHLALKVVFTSIFSLYFLIGTISNVFLFAVVRKVQVQQRGKPIKAMQRFLTLICLRSLTVCNIFNSMGPTVLRIVRLVYGSVSSNHWSCRASRFFTFAPSIVLILHEVVMSIERYYSLFEPMSVCSTKAVEKILAGAWAGGVMLTLGLVSSATIVQVDLGHNLYSTACRQALDTMVMKIIFYVSVIMAFVIPAILMFTIAIKVKRFLKQRRQRVEEGKPEFLDRAYAWRLKDAQMLVSIVLTFLVPYALIFFYGVILLITKVDLDFYFSFSILNISGVLAFSNCISIPLVCLVKNRQFREIAWQMLSCQP